MTLRMHCLTERITLHTKGFPYSDKVGTVPANDLFSLREKRDLI